MYQSVMISGTPANNVSSGQAMSEMEKVSDELLPKDMGYSWSGTSLQEKQSAGQIGPILAMALTFVYLFLVALYESWTLPIAVMLISPVALVGALFFQYVSGYALDIYAQIGLVMLVGLGTKQAILIVEFAKDAMEKDGMNYIDAAMEAARLRFRAVMMTNIAFILGLLPLVFAHGAGAGSRNSIGMTVFGGMMAVSCIGSILVPAFFVMINVMKDWYYAGGLNSIMQKNKKLGSDLIQKIKNASAKIKNRKNDNFRFSVSGDGTDFNGNERNGTELNGQKLDEDYFAALERGDLQAADAMVNNQYRICWRQQSKKKTPER